MNALPDLAFWARLLGVLSVQVTMVVLLAWVVTHRLRSGRAKRWCWRAVFVLAGGWLIAESFGMERMGFLAADSRVADCFDAVAMGAGEVGAGSDALHDTGGAIATRQAGSVA